jgi:hypothetical protein
MQVSSLSLLGSCVIVLFSYIPFIYAIIFRSITTHRFTEDAESTFPSHLTGSLQITLLDAPCLADIVSCMLCHWFIQDGIFLVRNKVWASWIQLRSYLEKKSSGSWLESREYSCRDPLCWPLGTLYPQKLALTSPTSGGHSVGIVRSWTQSGIFLKCLYTFL